MGITKNQACRGLPPPLHKRQSLRTLGNSQWTIGIESPGIFHELFEVSPDLCPPAPESLETPPTASLSPLEWGAWESDARWTHWVGLGTFSSFPLGPRPAVTREQPAWLDSWVPSSSAPTARALHIRSSRLRVGRPQMQRPAGYPTVSTTTGHGCRLRAPREPLARDSRVGSRGAGGAESRAPLFAGSAARANAPNRDGHAPHFPISFCPPACPLCPNIEDPEPPPPLAPQKSLPRDQ